MSIRARFQIQQESFRLDVDLDLPSRGVTSLFGPSGCGKTTLLRAMAGLEQHPGGFLEVDGEVWQNENQFVPVHRRPLGYVFQEASLFEHLNVRRNIAYGARRISKTEQKVSVDNAIELLGVENLLDRKPGSLSGGERQRVAIARALAVSPKLLLMDEPLAAVDVSRKQEILPYIDALHQELEIPVIHVSHLPEEVSHLADHMVLMDAGRVLASGDVHDVFTRLDLPLAHDREAASIIEAVVSDHDHEYHLTRVTFPGGEFQLALQALATGAPVRMRVAARDVSLTLERQSGTSILNILECTVDEISAEDEARVKVRLVAGKSPILAEITRKSAHDLDLKPGKTVYAQIKSIALLG